MATPNINASTSAPPDPIVPRNNDDVARQNDQDQCRVKLVCTLLGLNPETEQRALETILDDFNGMPVGSNTHSYWDLLSIVCPRWEPPSVLPRRQYGTTPMADCNPVCSTWPGWSECDRGRCIDIRSCHCKKSDRTYFADTRCCVKNCN